MTGSEFINLTSKLENYFGKEYTTEQRKIMYDILKDWSIQKYGQAVKYCLENCKYLPKIADFKQASTDYKPNYNNKNDNFEYVDCAKCKRRGLISYFKKWEDNRYEYVALCTCENGQHLKETEYRFLPFINEINRI